MGSLPLISLTPQELQSRPWERHCRAGEPVVAQVSEGPGGTRSTGGSQQSLGRTADRHEDSRRPPVPATRVQAAPSPAAPNNPKPT